MSPASGTPSALSSIPVTLLSGALGVGKTTALRHLLDHVRPAGERWAILLNEAGEVGLDAALLEGTRAAQDGEDEVGIREVPGGCICCTSGVMFQMSLTLLLQRMRPDRVLIEPSGVAEPGVILDMLRSEAFAQVLDVRATITLVDPRKLFDERFLQREVNRDQLEAADILVANRTDLCSVEEIVRFEQFAAELYPPKLLVATTAHGELDPSWLDLEPRSGAQVHAPARTMRAVAAPPVLHVTLDRLPEQRAAQQSDRPRIRHDAHVHACGWLLPSTQRFVASALRDLLESLPSHPALPDGLLRVKGVLQTEHGWVAFNVTEEGEIDARPSSHRRDARLEILAPGDGARPDWERLDEALRATFLDEQNPPPALF